MRSRLEIELLPLHQSLCKKEIKAMTPLVNKDNQQAQAPRRHQWHADGIRVVISQCSGAYGGAV